METSFVFRDKLLRGKTAFVTGGATGIGRGIVNQLARAGADIVIASRRAELCEAAAREVAEAYGVRALGLQLDVRRSEQVQQVMDAAAEQMGGLDVLVNNAAGNFYYPAQNLSDNQWKAVLEIDLYGTFYCSRAAFQHLQARGGSIISISMTLHHQGWVGMAPACAAKAGIDALTKTLAQEWGRFGIRVNAIAPGPILTEGVKKAFALGGDFEAHQESVPLGRPGQPEEIGNLAVFIASEAGAWMTGSIVVMDGGESLSPRRAGVAPEVLEQLAEMMQAQRKEG